MANVSTILGILEDTSNPSADDALLAALQNVGDATLEAILETLFARGTDRGLIGLIQEFDRLSESCQARIVEHAGRLTNGLRLAFQSKEEQVRLNVFEIIKRGRAYWASYLLNAGFHDRTAAVREIAAETLWVLGRHLLEQADGPADHEVVFSTNDSELHDHVFQLKGHAENRHHLLGAIEAGLVTYGVHRDNHVIETAMVFADHLDAKTWAVLAAPGSRVGQTAMKLLAESPHPLFVPFAMSALAYGQFRGQLVTFLSRCTDQSFLVEWIRQSWRIAQPKIARGMASIKSLAGVEERTLVWSMMAADDQRHFVQSVAATSLPPQNRGALLKDMACQSQDAAARAAAWSLVEWRTAQSDPLLRMVARQGDSRTAAIALLELARRHPEQYPLDAIIRVLEKAVQNVQKTSDHVENPQTFQDYWEMFDGLTDEMRIQYGKQVIEGPTNAGDHLSRFLKDSQVVNRVRALRMIHLLGLTPRYEPEVYQLCHDPEAEVRSTAVAALGTLPTATSRRILQNSLNDQDARVEANAVEALDRTGDQMAVPQLLPKLQSQNNRVRANTIKALLKRDIHEAVGALHKMLADPNPVNRVSALWVIQKMELVSLARQVVDIAVSDPSPKVRDRAHRMVEHLSPPIVHRDSNEAAMHHKNPEVSVTCS